MASNGPVPGAGSSGVVPWPRLTSSRPGLGAALPGCVFGVARVSVVGVWVPPFVSPPSSSPPPANTSTAPTTKATATTAAAIPRHPTSDRLTLCEQAPDGLDGRLGAAVLPEQPLEQDRRARAWVAAGPAGRNGCVAQEPGQRAAEERRAVDQTQVRREVVALECIGALAGRGASTIRLRAELRDDERLARELPADARKVVWQLARPAAV